MLNEYIEQRNQHSLISFAIILIVMIIAGFFQTCSLVYSKLFAIEYDAHVVRVLRSEDAIKRPLLTIKYEFTDSSGELVALRETLPYKTQVRVGDQLRIRYHEDDENPYEIVDSKVPITVYLFGIGSVVGIGWIVVLAREANA